MKKLITILTFVSFSTMGQTINLTKIAKIESNFDSTVINPAGDCYGLFQISEICLKEYNKTNNLLYKPFISVPVEDYEVESVNYASLNYKIICKILYFFHFRSK